MYPSSSATYTPEPTFPTVQNKGELYKMGANFTLPIFPPGLI